MPSSTAGLPHYDDFLRRERERTGLQHSPLGSWCIGTGFRKEAVKNVTPIDITPYMDFGDLNPSAWGVSIIESLADWRGRLCFPTSEMWKTLYHVVCLYLYGQGQQTDTNHLTSVSMFSHKYLGLPVVKPCFSYSPLIIWPKSKGE